MSPHHPGTTDEEKLSDRLNAMPSRSPLETRARNGSLAMVAGGASLVWALASVRKNKTRATMLALSSLALLGIGMQQRRAEQEDTETAADALRTEDGEKRVSDEAYAEAEQNLGAQRTADESASTVQSETEPNPRGMADRSDTKTEGDPQFVEGKQGRHRETHLEDDSAHDPRLHPESDDEPTEIDLSEAAMADEASEATGPHPEQAYPAREGTDPEPSSAETPEWIDEAADASEGTSTEDDDTPDADESNDVTRGD